MNLFIIINNIIGQLNLIYAWKITSSSCTISVSSFFCSFSLSPLFLSLLSLFLFFFSLRIHLPSSIVLRPSLSTQGLIKLKVSTHCSRRHTLGRAHTHRITMWPRWPGSSSSPPPTTDIPPGVLKQWKNGRQFFVCNMRPSRESSSRKCSAPRTNELWVLNGRSKSPLGTHGVGSPRHQRKVAMIDGQIDRPGSTTHAPTST